MNLPRMAYDRAAEQAATHRKRGEDRCVTLRGPTTAAAPSARTPSSYRRKPSLRRFAAAEPVVTGAAVQTSAQAQSAVANTDTKLLIDGLFQKGRVLAQDEVERLVPGPFPGDEEAQKLRLRLRKERSRPILSSIHEWALTQRGLPRSDFGKAVRYMLERWAKLTLFVENSLVYPDNNAAERALRGPVVGRKKNPRTHLECSQL